VGIRKRRSKVIIETTQEVLDCRILSKRKYRIRVYKRKKDFENLKT